MESETQVKSCVALINQTVALFMRITCISLIVHPLLIGGARDEAARDDVS